jgi:murein DD-endopeptidase MepM/ murein hydrolase activator NlpD
MRNLFRNYKYLKFLIWLLSLKSVAITLTIVLIAAAAEAANQEMIQAALILTGSSNEDGDIDFDIPPIINDGASIVFPIREPARLTCSMTCYPNHRGTDWSAFFGATIVAVMDGTVTRVVNHHASNGGFWGHPGGWGNLVRIQHANGIETLYSHLKTNIPVRVGQQVVAGQVIGFQGNSGNSTGPHLHFEWIENGRLIDPETRVPPQRR